MVPQRTFKKTVIALTDDFADKEKMSNWVQHAGGKVSKDITDEITHLVMTRRKWNDYHKDQRVVSARRKGTVYLVNYLWLEESLNLNHGKLLDETNKRYTWEPKHAQRVLKKRQLRQNSARRERQRRLKKAKEEAQSIASDECLDSNATVQSNRSSEEENCPLKRNQSKLSSNAQKLQLAPRNTGSESVPQRTTKRKDHDSIETEQCGIKFDNALLEFERGMAKRNYHPYVDDRGVLYMITLVRNDVLQNIQEQHTLKSCSEHASTYRDNSFAPKTAFTAPKIMIHARPSKVSICKRSPKVAVHFEVNKNTITSYLNDDCNGILRRAHDYLDSHYLCGQCSSYSRNQKRECLPANCHTTFVNDAAVCQNSQKSDLHGKSAPFGAYWTVPYHPHLDNFDFGLDKIFPVTRVHIPQPFAYSLQLYETSKHSKAKSVLSSELEMEDTATSTSSFTTNVSNSASASASTTASENSSISTESLSMSCDSLSGTGCNFWDKKEYFLAIHFTKKGKQRISTTQVLAPEGSTWDFAYDMFHKFFRRKTGLNWEKVPMQQEVETGCKPTLKPEQNVRSNAQHNLHDTSRLNHLVDRQKIDCKSTHADETSAEHNNGAYILDRFRYVPNCHENVQDIAQKYAKRYGEDWLAGKACDLDEFKL